ncbi:MAG: LysM peptidoglycan-binding domain-containing protein [Ardenticatenaceae bacterium]|nr:LysM peptidoglycan-binding domain-containing protein [Anaerolineales bacterium]MCB8921828.1 LysM peptidoglycan-binding domain-containing protein [Ardenticatenaceae bacterium]MCB8991014.1 LysM peptidoglycan-binding domain-containing protein [Ardenticatenaceae bacterium]MCB9005306.1 LysM peptidoglycan-binding domain-containing protein [Ardenticatenaceae bacterium]
MSESANTPQEPALSSEPRRCPNCDTVVDEGATQCLMCGEELPVVVPPTPEPLPDSAPQLEAAQSASPAVEEAKVEQERPSRPRSSAKPRDWHMMGVRWMTAVFALFILIISALILRFQSPGIAVALFPSVTPIPPTPSHTPTWTPWPTETPRPSATPTLTLTPAPTVTPEPPLSHEVVSGETLIGLSLRYRVSMESIASSNGFTVDTPIQLGQTLLIPWPTATPPLVPVAEEINGEVVIADPTDCQRHEVEYGDSISGIAARYDIDFNLFLQVNRLTNDTILQRGDTLCIPEIIYGGNLPPTPGPSPTPSPTAPLPGPYLLYPANGTVIEPPQDGFTLQWAAVKDLGAEEWYMVELLDLDAVDQPPYRAFTRDTAFHVPSDWRPDMVETHLFRWRVSIVQVTGHRSDGQFIYTYGGETSEDGSFSWLGAVPTPTPTPTATPTLTPTLDSQ